MRIDLTAILLFIANIFLGVLVAQFNDLRGSLKETREKLDGHVQDFKLHRVS